MASKKIKASKTAAKQAKGAKNATPPPSKPNPARPVSTMSQPHRSSSAAPSGVRHRPTDEINVSVQHSFELARIAMTSAICMIVHLRKIFPASMFARRLYDCNDPESSYDAFMKGAKSPFTFEPADSSFIFKILTRGTKDAAANKLLDWIELAATNALEMKYLAKLQLSFHSIDGCQVSDANLLEAYTMCFTYVNGELHIGTAEGTNAPTNSVVLRDAKQGLSKLVEGIFDTIHTAGKTPLPGDRRMNMTLLYNCTCPSDYQPKGFHDNPDPNRLIAGYTGIEMGSMNTGFHGVSINLYKQNCDSIQNHQSSQDHQLSLKRRRIDLRSPSISSEVDDGGTQEHGLNLLRGMGSYRVPETQNTQLVNGTTQPAAKDGHLPTSQASMPAFLPYSQTIMERIEQIRKDKRARQEEYDLDEVQRSDRRVNCECAALADEGHLIQCDICDDFKHVQCYGHLGSLPPTAKFACYSCLLYIEPVLLSQMKVTCVRRRALYYLYEHSPLKSIEDLAQYIDRDEGITKDILSQLELQGYIKRTAAYEKTRKGKGKSNAAEPLFTLIADNQMLLGNIFRPELDIPHKLLLPTSPSPKSATLSETGNEEFEQDLTRSSIGFAPKSGQVQEHAPLVQPTLSEASSTEGTPSPRSAIAQRFFGHQAPAQNPRPLSFGSSHLSRKRLYDSTVEPELNRPAHYQQGAGGAAPNQDSSNVRKLSEVNSPYTFRSSAL